MTDWRDAEPATGPISLRGWVLVILRIVPLATIIYGGLIILILARAIEAPLYGAARPITPYITQGVCKLTLAVMGIKLARQGKAMRLRGALVANHASWLDIFVLNACDRVYFVAKSEVSAWPGIGWLARATGTVFIARNPAEAKQQQQIFEDRLRAGHRLLFFPEGTSTDSMRVLSFKSTLFAAFFTQDMKSEMYIQPVSLRYISPDGVDPRLYGWFGGMDFGPHFLWILAQPRQGRVEVGFHPPVAVHAFKTRKELTAHCEAVIRAGFEAVSR
ncbi:1-acyl-sn-glycerol-3-phosphate acyltransferase [Pseudorhodobacter sp.]|uniref:lysophospholipid acyltransferase family protein n=1 Tax=Pseudorhodobacter sp. TaxID=1934400 RepID=UPI002649CF92|nr:lysophospholipid acyltransferase family protein [Pseudorhodobacter sp.]MDN5786949.1 1-acyl-sn-glycerol-3-phosphate acyltransferase [Pseudorhodobacter sp.]